MKRIIYIAIVCSLIFQQSQSQGTWTQKANFPVPKESAVAFSIGDFGYIGTGSNPYLTKDFWKYDPVTDTWVEIASMPTWGRVGAISFVINNKGYVGGGKSGSGIISVDKELWEYDPQTNTWTRKADLPKFPGSSSTLTSFVIREKGYLLTTFYEDDFWEYSPQTDTWTRKADFPGVGKMHQVGFSIGEKGYVGTGFPGGLNNTAEFWEYDPTQDKWAKKADLPDPPLKNAVGFSINNTGYIGLGVSNYGVFHNEFWAYHPETDSWNQIESCGFAAADAVGMSIGSKGYVGTGLFEGVNFREYTPELSSASTYEQSCLVNVYPNPVNDRLFVDVDYPGPITFSIYSILGQTVKTGVTTERSISVADLTEGVYVYKILLANKLVVRQFIKD